MTTNEDKSDDDNVSIDLNAAERSSPSLTKSLEDEGTTLYERKCVLINREIDAMGMGKYQWYLWSLCGFGYMIDLMWAQAFGLVLSPMQQELGFGPGQTGNLSTAFSSGLTAGAFVWGVLVDIIGRKWAFNLTVLISSIFGLCLGIPDTYDCILVLTAFCGFGVGGNIPIDTTITLEFTPQSRRYLLPLLSIFQPLGVVLCSAIAYGLIPNYSCSPNFSEADPLPACSKVQAGEACCRKADNMGWRYLLFTLGAITLLVFILRFIVFNFQESPKFLVYRGNDKKAIQVLGNVARKNGQTTNLTLEKLQAFEKDYAPTAGNSVMLGAGTKQLKTTWTQKLKLEIDRFKILFSSHRMARLTILVWLTYICDYWGFTVAGFYLPQIIALKNGSLNLSLRYTYRSYIYIYLPGTVGVLLGSLLYRTPTLGRKYTMMLSSALMAISIFVFSTVNSAASNIGLNLMEYFFQSMFNAVLYGWTPEAFPAPIRGTACGLASFWGRLFGIVSPLIAQHLHSEEVLDIPEGVKVAIKSRNVVVEGPRGKLTKSLGHLAVSFSHPKSNVIKIELHHGSRKSVATLRTVRTLINNLIIGVTKGFLYKMRYVYAHFPINVNLEKNKETDCFEVEIRNFIGEKIVRRVVMRPGVFVEASKNTKDELQLSGNSIEDVSQSAADIQQICRVRNKDIRKFLDGLYVSEKSNIEE
ncbi:major facilitator superfamily domain-containing protein [Clohesyomyces aquaticus]|uniref:Major facilitator superfamily domain-containing protein n=1 Tax=Clohesyomyces aquaticus TaxID=1231657 RepID=A0A1Y2A4K3_9PLEO|nr:major facilitator superfamily domain-containing protein [Clohesyomyces aquaticus]